MKVMLLFLNDVVTGTEVFEAHSVIVADVGMYNALATLFHFVGATACQPAAVLFIPTPKTFLFIHLLPFFR